MVDRVLIDTLNLKARSFAAKWAAKVGKASQFQHYAALSGEALIELNAPVYPQLARALDRGLDRSLVGGFFVGFGQRQIAKGFPVSETIYGVNLAQQVVNEYLMNEFAPEGTVRMYQALDASSRMAEFFLLGCFYLTKGALEAIYTSMKKHDAVSEQLLKKYFRDDFFFKNDPDSAARGL
ncbi:MAG: hypothetical protein LBH70_00105 [Spirochaetaceae bacterium]|jgi:hypothetical protein|nr:hypothetical protein [Spirochaetaceae bacterium]